MVDLKPNVRVEPGLVINMTKSRRTDWWFLAEMILVTSGSQSTRSASEPTAMRPLRGYMLKILAALVLVTDTNWFSSIFPDTWREHRGASVNNRTRVELFQYQYRKFVRYCQKKTSTKNKIGSGEYASLCFDPIPSHV